MFQLWLIGNIEIEEVIQSSPVFYGGFDTIFKIADDFPLLFSKTQIVLTTRREAVSWNEPSAVYIMPLPISVGIGKTIATIFALSFTVF